MKETKADDRHRQAHNVNRFRERYNPVITGLASIGEGWYQIGKGISTIFSFGRVKPGSLPKESSILDDQAAFKSDLETMRSDSEAVRKDMEKVFGKPFLPNKSTRKKD